MIGTINRSSVWVDNEDIKCNGLTVKWSEGEVSSGRLLIQVGTLSSFNETEILKEIFLVLQVEFMRVN